jgi:hypothetical protein
MKLTFLFALIICILAQAMCLILVVSSFFEFYIGGEIYLHVSMFSNILHIVGFISIIPAFIYLFIFTVKWFIHLYNNNL